METLESQLKSRDIKLMDKDKEEVFRRSYAAQIVKTTENTDIVTMYNKMNKDFGKR